MGTGAFTAIGSSGGTIKYNTQGPILGISHSTTSASNASQIGITQNGVYEITYYLFFSEGDPIFEIQRDGTALPANQSLYFNDDEQTLYGQLITTLTGVGSGTTLEVIYVGKSTGTTLGNYGDTDFDPDIVNASIIIKKIADA
jgi:hypothetical protein